MRNTWTIAKREYKVFFITPMAYVVSFAFLAIIGYLFSVDLATAVLQSDFQPAAPGVEILLGPLIWMMLFIMMPAVTMRSLADEQKMGTLELLLTAPVRDWELVVGKWLGSILFALTLVVMTWIYPVILNLIIDPGIDIGQLAAGYLGIVLFSGALISIGIAVSALFSNPNAALVLNYVIVLLLWFLRPMNLAGGGVTDRLITYLNFVDHYINFFRGIIDLTDVIYYLSVTAFSLFLGAIIVETRRWR